MNDRLRMILKFFVQNDPRDNTHSITDLVTRYPDKNGRMLAEDVRALARVGLLESNGQKAAGSMYRTSVYGRLLLTLDGSEAALGRQVIEHLARRQVRPKPSKKLLVAVSWIRENDPQLTYSVRQIAAAAGVSVGTAQSAVRYIRDGILP